MCYDNITEEIYNDVQELKEKLNNLIIDYETDKYGVSLNEIQEEANNYLKNNTKHIYYILSIESNRNNPLILSVKSRNKDNESEYNTLLKNFIMNKYNLKINIIINYNFDIYY